MIAENAMTDGKQWDLCNILIIIIIVLIHQFSSVVKMHYDSQVIMMLSVIN